jgi:hypothetical protein
LLSGVVGVPLVAPVKAALAGTLQVSSLRHFHGVLLTPGGRDAVEAVSLRLPAVARDDSVFILSTYAAFSYLATGTRNPTPYDFPLATAFGKKGEEQVISALTTRRIRFVCLDPHHRAWGLLQPERLTRYIQEAMDPVADAGLCTVYGLRPGSPGDEITRRTPAPAAVP